MKSRINPTLHFRRLIAYFTFAIICFSTQSQTLPIKHEFELKTEDNFNISAFSITNKNEVDNRPTILLLHGGGRNKEIWEQRGTVQDMYELGYNIVAIDIRGNGKSDPQVEGQFASPIPDLKAAVDWIYNNDQFKSGKIGAFGSSYGSNTLVTAAVLTNVKIETFVIFSVTAVAPRIITNPQNVRLKPPYQNNQIRSAFYIASDNEVARYEAATTAEHFYQQTNPERRMKLIIPGQYHGSSLYISTKEKVKAWLQQELPINK